MGPWSSWSRVVPTGRWWRRFKVVYSDGDSEDLNGAELLEGLKLAVGEKPVAIPSGQADVYRAIQKEFKTEKDFEGTVYSGIVVEFVNKLSKKELDQANV